MQQFLTVHPAKLLACPGPILDRMNKQTPVQRWGKIWVWHGYNYSSSVCECRNILLCSSSCAVSLGFRAKKYCLAHLIN